MKQLPRKQAGLSLLGLIFISALLIFFAIMGMKVVPAVIDYYTILADVKGLGNDTSLREGGVAQVRAAYRKRMEISLVKDVAPEDLDITKEGNDIVISFAYQRKIPLIANASLLLDFEGTSAPSGK